MRLLGRFSLGVQPSFTVFFAIPAPALCGSYSLGVFFPYSVSSIGDPRPCSFPLRPPSSFQAGIAPATPTLPITVPLTGFFNLSAACFLQHRPTIFRWVTLLGFRPSGVFPLTQPRTAPRRRHALLTLFRWSSTSVLSGSSLRRVPLLRSQRSRLSSSLRPSSA